MREKQTSSDQLLDQFLASAEQLEMAVLGLSTAELDLQREEGEWTIRAIIHHLVDDGDVWSICIKKAVATPGALIRFEGFPGNQAWAAGLDFEEREVTTGMDLIITHRHYLVALLRSCPAAWKQTVRLANAEGIVRREMSVGDIVQMLTEHMMEHVAEIRSIRQMHGV